MNVAKSNDVLGASVTRGSGQSDQMEVIGHYRAECLDAQGNVKWVEDFDNLVTTQGKNHLLDHGLAGPASAVTTRMSFINNSPTPAIVIGDNYQTHGGFTELGSGVIATRGTPSYSAASAGAKATSAAVSASVIGTGVVAGVAINLAVGTATNLGTVADTTAGYILYSAGTFATAKSVSNGDTLNVTYTTTLT